MKIIRLILSKLILYCFKDYFTEVFNEEFEKQIKQVYTETSYKREETSYYIKLVCDEIYDYIEFIKEDYGEFEELTEEDEDYCNEKLQYLYAMITILNGYHFSLTGGNVNDVKLSKLPDELKLVGFN